MKTAEYLEYVIAVDAFFAEHALDNLSTCDDEPESHFSHRRCECCQRPLGGDRYSVSGYSRTQGVLNFEICEDCLYFAECGQLDDMELDGVDHDIFCALCAGKDPHVLLEEARDSNS